MIPIKKWACGNCGLMNPGQKSCGLGLGKRELEGYGCCVGLSHFQDRGVSRTFSHTVGETDTRTVMLARLPWDKTLNKIRIGFECPNEIFQSILPLGDFNFALTKEVLKNGELAEYYRTSKKFCFLDNSTNEELVPCSLKEIEQAANLIHPDKIVAPDFLGNSTKTLAGLPATIDTFGRGSVLPVIQGSSLEEVFDCARGIRGHSLDCIAVPYDLILGRNASVADMARVRSLVVYHLTNVLGFKKIHLLGLTSLEELIYYWWDPETRSHVKSIDTGGPILMGLKGVHYPQEWSYKQTPTLRLMESFSATHNLETVLWNISFLRTLL